MRHGHSQANQQRIIVSDPANGLLQYGLSERGCNQVAESVQGENRLDRETLIISSDFKRAEESAGIAHRLLSCNQQYRTDQRLRERYFGDLEMQVDSRYAEVWRADAKNADSSPFGAESTNQVVDRVSALVVDLECSMSGKTFLLVSHGDALQILQTAFLKQESSRHRQVEHFNTANIRELQLLNQDCRCHLREW